MSERLQKLKRVGFGAGSGYSIDENMLVPKVCNSAVIVCQPTSDVALCCISLQELTTILQIVAADNTLFKRFLKSPAELSLPGISDSKRPTDDDDVDEEGYIEACSLLIGVLKTKIASYETSAAANASVDLTE